MHARVRVLKTCKCMEGWIMMRSGSRVICGVFRITACAACHSFGRLRQHHHLYDEKE